MTDWLIRLHLWLARHRWALATAVVIFTLAAILSGQRLRLNEDYTDMLPMSDPAVAGYVEALKHIRQAERLFVDVQTLTTNAAELAEAADALAAELREVKELTDIRDRFDAADLQQVFEQWQTELPTLLNSNELAALESKLQLSEIEKRLAWMKKSMSQPQGLMVKDVVQRDPVGLSDVVATRWRALQAGVGDAQLVAGRITSTDGCHVLISAVPAFRSSELTRSHPLISAVLGAAREVEGRFPNGVVRVAVTGAHRSALDNATVIREDTKRTAGIAIIAVAVLLVSAFRRRWLALLGLLPTVFGALGTMVVFYLTGDPVSAVALGCGSILIGVTDDYGVCMLYYLDDTRPADRPTLARGIVQLVPMLIFGALTTMAAFLVMLISPVSGHRQLGWFGAVGVALAVLFAILVLPVFMPTGGGKAHGALPVTRILERLFAWRARHARLVLPPMIVFSLVCGIGAVRLRFEGDFSRMNGVTASTRDDDNLIREVWGKALSLTTVLVRGSTLEEALQKNERVCAVLRSLQDDRAIESFSSIAPVLPSARMRQANARDWQAFWSNTRRAELSNALTTATAKLGFRAAAFQPFLQRLVNANVLTGVPPAVPFSVRDTPGSTLSELRANRLLADYVSEQNGQVFILTLAKAPDRASYDRLRAAVLQATPDALFLNKGAMADDVLRVAKRGLPLFGGLVAALNALLLYVLLGRLNLVAITLLPMAAGVFWTLGVMGLIGVPVDMANFIFVIFIIGVGGDYSLFLVTAELETLRGYPPRMASTGGAVAICALTTLFGVGVLVLARHPALFSVGLTALLGISLSLVATLFLVPACMEQLRQRVAADRNPLDGSQPLRQRVGRLYRYQGPFVTQSVFWKMKLDPLFRAVDVVVPKQGIIVDLGCGYGMVAHWLTLSSPERTVRGVDADVEKIRVARATAEGNPRVRFEVGDILDWELPACDCVLLCDVLHYLPRELKVRVLRKAFAALPPGGCLVVRDAARSQTRGHWSVEWAEKWAVWAGVNQTRHGLHFEDEQTHLALLREAGFALPAIQQDAGLGSNALMVATRT